MARLLKQKLISKLKDGEFKCILEFVNNDSELSLEIRTSSVAIVYYKKSKILSLHSRCKEPKMLSAGYWKNEKVPSIDLQQPELYFQIAKTHVDNFTTKKNNIEFSIQQKIHTDNNSVNNAFLTVDMEYQFAQNIIKERTSKKTRFDIVAVDLLNNKIILFELKQGFASSEGTSGVTDHLSKYVEHIKHPEFSKSLISDIKSIIEQKETLGIFSFDSKPILNNLDSATIEFNVIFAFNNIDEKLYYQKKYGIKNKTLFVDISDSKYILKQDDL